MPSASDSPDSAPLSPHEADIARTCLLDLLTHVDGLDWSLSIQIGPQGPALTEERSLFFFHNTAAAVARLETAAAALHMPATMIARWQAALDNADAIGLTVNRALTSARLYTQYWEPNLARVLQGNLAPFVLYRGFKTLAGGVSRDDVYHCTPLISQDIFRPLLTAALAELGLPAKATALAFAGIAEENTIFTRTSGEGRESWLLTVRKAPVDHGNWIKALDHLPQAPWATGLRAHAQNQQLLHVAAGEDTKKGRFVTLYFDASPDAIRRFLTPHGETTTPGPVT